MPKKGQFSRSASARSKYQRKYNSTPLQKKRRATRNASRRKAIASGRVRKGSSKDVDHVNRRSLKGATRVISRSKNRARNSPLGLRRRRR